MPSHLEEKSQVNFKSAQLLINNQLFASSVHCSYYGMFQFLICMFSEKTNKNFDEITYEQKEKALISILLII